MSTSYRPTSLSRRIAIIPARGGSKRLPRKNILPVGGRPMLCWSVDAALQSGLFDRVCVSTDDNEIADIASKTGADVLIRPDSLASDSATVAEVCDYHLKCLADCGEKYDFLFCLYPTAPLRNAEDLISIASIFTANIDAIAVIAVCNYMHYAHQALQIGANGSLKPFWPELIDLRSNKLPHLVAGNGSTYAIRVESFMQTRNFVPESGLYAHHMDLFRSIDVDTINEYELLQAVSSFYGVKSN